MLAWWGVYWSCHRLFSNPVLSKGHIGQGPFINCSAEYNGLKDHPLFQMLYFEGNQYSPLLKQGLAVQMARDKEIEQCMMHMIQINEMVELVDLKIGCGDAGHGYGWDVAAGDEEEMEENVEEEIDLRRWLSMWQQRTQGDWAILLCVWCLLNLSLSFTYQEFPKSKRFCWCHSGEWSSLKLKEMILVEPINRLLLAMMQLLSNYLVITAITVFLTSDLGYRLYFQLSNHGFWQEEQEKWAQSHYFVVKKINIDNWNFILWALTVCTKIALSAHCC